MRIMRKTLIASSMTWSTLGGRAHGRSNVLVFLSCLVQRQIEDGNYDAKAQCTTLRFSYLSLVHNDFPIKWIGKTSAEIRARILLI